MTAQLLDPAGVLAAPPATPSALTARTAQFTSLTRSTDSTSGLVDVTYSGFQTTLSEVLAGLGAAPVNSVTVFADSLVIDVPIIATSGLIIMARQLDASALAGRPLLLRSPAALETVTQFVLGNVTGGTFSIAPAAQPASAITPTFSMTALTATAYIMNGIGPLTPAGSSSFFLQDLLRRTWPLNALHASFAAATWLMDDASAASRADAQQMLAWVVLCATAVASDSGSLPSSYADLYSQAAALLVTMNLEPGAVFVPVLAGPFYSAEIPRLLTVLRDYEAAMATLETQSDIATAVVSVSAGLYDTAGDEAAPLTLQLSNIKTNMQSLSADILNLRGSFNRQQTVAQAAFSAMTTSFQLAAIDERLSRELGVTTAVIGVGFDAAKFWDGDPEGFTSAVKDGLEGIQTAIDASKTISDDAGDDLTQSAVDLLKAQQSLLGTVLNGELLWQQAENGKSAGVLPSTLAAITIDPVTSWDNFTAVAEATIISVEPDADEAQASATLYVASLKVLAGYGKAISGKFAAYVSQAVKATVVQAQIVAAQNVQARWSALRSSAKSDAEKLAALKTLVQARADSVKRSIYVGWTYYAASYFYLNFAAPPQIVHVDMTAAAFEDALAGVAAWIAGAMQQTTSGGQVMLPSTETNLQLRFPVRRGATTAAGDLTILAKDNATGNAGETALLEATADGGWLLNWAVALASPQLRNNLPNGGNCAIWISKTSFFLDGVQPNAAGNVIATVSTSGTYENGFGPDQRHIFVTKGLSGNYIYNVPNETVSSSWAVNPAVYTTPTLYTVWTLAVPAGDADLQNVTALRMVLDISYLAPS